MAIMETQNDKNPDLAEIKRRLIQARADLEDCRDLLNKRAVVCLDKGIKLGTDREILSLYREFYSHVLNLKTLERELDMRKLKSGE